MIGQKNSSLTIWWFGQGGRGTGIMVVLWSRDGFDSRQIYFSCKSLYIVFSRWEHISYISREPCAKSSSLLSITLSSAYKQKRLGTISSAPRLKTQFKQAQHGNTNAPPTGINISEVLFLASNSLQWEFQMREQIINDNKLCHAFVIRTRGLERIKRHHLNFFLQRLIILQQWITVVFHLFTVVNYIFFV